MTRAFLGAVLLLIAPALACADTIELRSGERVEGTLKEATPQSVVLQIAGRTLSFPTSDVRAIYFGASTSPRKLEADSAIRALKALRSVAELGVSYADYRQRLADTKIKVDEYLEVKASPRERSIQAAVKSALLYYQTALPIWEQQLKRDGAVPLVLVDSLHRLACPGLRVQTQRILDAYAQTTERVGTRADSSYTQNMIPGIWSCASDRIKEADELAGRP